MHITLIKVQHNVPFLLIFNIYIYIYIYTQTHTHIYIYVYIKYGIKKVSGIFENSNEHVCAGEHLIE